MCKLISAFHRTILLLYMAFVVLQFPSSVEVLATLTVLKCEISTSATTMRVSKLKALNKDTLTY